MRYLFKLAQRIARGWQSPVLALAALSACASDAKAPTAVSESPAFARVSSAASISISPSTASGSLGQSAQFTATVYDPRGLTVSGQTITWTSTDSTIVAVTAGGFATAIGVGNASLVATAGSLSAQAPVSVTGTAIASISVSPGSASGSVGQSAQFTATLRDANGNVLTGRRVLWSSSAPTVVKLDTTGFATALAGGNATITANSGGKSGTATATVAGVAPAANPGAVTDLAVTAVTDTTATLSFTQVTDGSGGAANYDIRTGTGTLSWSSAAPVATGTCTTPLVVTAVGTKLSCTVRGLTASTAYSFQAAAYRGTLNVNAVVGALSNVASGTTAAKPVTGPIVASVVVSPSSASGSVGQSAQFSASALDANGATISTLPVTWSTTNAAVVGVTSAGYATATGCGSANLVATIGGKTGSSVITVSGCAITTPTPPPPSTGTGSSTGVTPSTATIGVGGTVQLSAALKDASGNLLNGAATYWVSAKSSIATVTSTGLVTGMAPGFVVVMAVNGSVTAASSIVVTTGAAAPSSAEPMPNFGTMLWSDNFDATSDAAILNGYEVMQGPGGVSVAPYLHAEAGAGVGGSGALRMDYVRSTTCWDDARGVNVYLSEKPTEYYVTFSVRYQPGFVWDWYYSGQAPCHGTAKKVFRTFTGESGTLPGFFFENESHELHAGNEYADARSPQDPNGPVTTLEQLADGNWHRFTFHVKQSSSGTANDGFFYGWLDGVRRWAVTNWVSGTALGPDGFKLPGTFNAGSPANQSEWIDNLRFWRP